MQRTYTSVFFSLLKHCFNRRFLVCSSFPEFCVFDRLKTVSTERHFPRIEKVTQVQICEIWWLIDDICFNFYLYIRSHLRFHLMTHCHCVKSRKRAYRILIFLRTVCSLGMDIWLIKLRISQRTMHLDFQLVISLHSSVQLFPFEIRRCVSHYQLCCAPLMWDPTRIWDPNNLTKSKNWFASQNTTSHK